VATLCGFALLRAVQSKQRNIALRACVGTVRVKGLFVQLTGDKSMEIRAADQLVHNKCKPCEGGVEACTLDESRQQLARLSGWYLTHDGQRIRKDWTVKNFVAGMSFFRAVAELAEEEGHHPDLHLEGYRNVWIELWTHAIGGLSENDFILAAKIDQLPVSLKK
jgi:4a-hydroxytetrahydrobiopterin dehydratase